MCYFVPAAHARRLLCLCFAVQQKQPLEKETGLKIVEAGLSDVSQAPQISGDGGAPAALAARLQTPVLSALL